MLYWFKTIYIYYRLTICKYNNASLHFLFCPLYGDFMPYNKQAHFILHLMLLRTRGVFSIAKKLDNSVIRLAFHFQHNLSAAFSIARSKLNLYWQTMSMLRITPCLSFRPHWRSRSSPSPDTLHRDPFCIGA